MARAPNKAEHTLFGHSGGAGGGSEPELLFGDPNADADSSGSPGMESLAPPLPPPPNHLTSEMAERLGRAIEVLRLTSDRLGAETAATALEIGCLVARRILEAELKTDTDAQKSLVRSAVRRLGDAHKVTIHLAPADLEAVRAAAGEASSADLGMNLGIAKVEILPDTNLTSGDCIVESDAAKVDGRLGTRLEEIRRVLSSIVSDNRSESS
jgi:flagellar biosynthesis/type III secretory pathway protein FliH